MNMELDIKEEVDPLVVSLTDVETKINEIQNDIDDKLRPTLVLLNEEGEPSLTKAQERSMISLQ